MRRVLPGVQFLDMTPDDPVFHAFFEIGDIAHFPQAYVGGDPVSQKQTAKDIAALAKEWEVDAIITGNGG